MTTAVRQAIYKRPWLYPKQLAAFFGPERYHVAEASVKSGKTHGALVWLTEQAMQGKAGQNFWWVSPIFAQAKIAFRRLKRALPLSIYQANETEMTLTLGNGAVMWFKSGEHPDALFGEDVYAAVVDEATRCREAAWQALRTTLTATRGQVRIIGNVKGRRNWAYRLARKAEAGEQDMAYSKITAHDAIEAGVLFLDEIEDAQRQLPESVFRELYLAEPSDDEGNPFGIEAIRRCVAPLSSSPAVGFGVDLAKSQDWSVIIGLDDEMHTSVYRRFQAPWQETIERIHQEVAKTPCLVDATGVGDPIVEALQRGGHPNFEGFHFTAQSKQQLMEGLALAIQQGQVTYPDGPIVAELESFEYSYSRIGVKYEAMQGAHDDCVCALALAVKRATMRAPRPFMIG